jgi:glutamate---cysteine ligase / carboxylate-amine ligase
VGPGPLEGRELPEWGSWPPAQERRAWTVGIEEEVMLLHANDSALASWVDSILPTLAPHLAEHVDAETHGSAIELRTGVHDGVPAAIAELAALRGELRSELADRGLRAAAAGMHPTTVWQETRISGGERYQLLYASLRELARREPTFALHVHVAVPDPEDALRAMNGMREHLPLLLALSANSPFWQGRETGLASTRTPMFGAFPRVGLPRAFADYGDYVESIDLLLRCGAFPEPTFLWWDVRLQPRWGTVEVRIMDAQITIADSAGLVALVQSLVHMEASGGAANGVPHGSAELLAENRFLAARDGMQAQFLDARREGQVSAHDVLTSTLDACAAHAEELGCREELESARKLSSSPGAERQREGAREAGGLAGLVSALADAF